MTHINRITLAGCVVVTVALLLAWSIGDTPETRLPEEYANVIATWANGRQTISFRVGEYYYIEDGAGMAEQHAGTPERWEYVR